VVCRRGNDSQYVVEELSKRLVNVDCVKDIIGGLQEWSKVVDTNFPKY
jgi:rhodanese-related sulfurtransferase